MRFDFIRYFELLIILFLNLTEKRAVSLGKATNCYLDLLWIYYLTSGVKNMDLIATFPLCQDKLFSVGKNGDAASIYGDYWLILIKEKQQWRTRSWLKSQLVRFNWLWFIKCCSSLNYLSGPSAPRICNSTLLHSNKNFLFLLPLFS